MRFSGKVCTTLLLWLLAVFACHSVGEDSLSPRLQIGISLFPAVIAANKRLATATDRYQKLPILLVHRNNLYHPKDLMDSLVKIPDIQGYQLQVDFISLEQLIEQNPKPISAIFISEQLHDHLPSLIEFSRKNRILLFSPFKGDVERGVSTGFQVTDKVLPMVNMGSLKRSNIDLKAFFLRIAVKHE